MPSRALAERLGNDAAPTTDSPNRGTNGTNGTTGTNGTNGTSGTNGTNGSAHGNTNASTNGGTNYRNTNGANSGTNSSDRSTNGNTNGTNGDNSNANDTNDGADRSTNGTDDSANTSDIAINTINVTKLTRKRLEAALAQTAKDNVNFLLLQETKLTNQPTWPLKIAQKYGFRAVISPEPPKERPYGGTAIFYRWTNERCRGHTTIITNNANYTHRAVTLRWAHMSIISAYGPQVTDRQFVTTLLRDAILHPTHTNITIGDFNWRKDYDGLIGAPLTINQPTINTTNNDTSPTRAVSNTHTPVITKATKLPEVPHHKLCTYTIQGAPPAPRPLERLTKTPTYEWSDQHRDVIIDKDHDICKTVNTKHPPLTNNPTLLERWQHVNKRLTCALKLCEKQQMVTSTRGERDIAQPATTTPYKWGAAHNTDQTIRYRRLLRLHRRLHHNYAPNDLLSEGHQRHVYNARDILHAEYNTKHHKDTRAQAPTIDFRCLRSYQYHTIAKTLDGAITDETHYMQRANGMLWRERSKRCFTPQFWECTSLALKPQSPPTNLNPEEATEQLANYWTPTNTAPTSMSDQQKTNNWEHMADAAGIAHLPQKPTPTREEARGEFAKRCRKAKGAPGIDGWTATLTKLTANHIPFISYEVADILYDAAFLNDTDDSTSTDADATLPHRRPSQPTCSSADGVANNPNDGPAHPQHHCDDATTSRQGLRTPNDQLIEFANQFYRLRVTCLRKTDEKVRGISVASILARNWHSTLLVLLTLTPSDPNQHGSCPKRSVITATASWLAATATAASGSELDLSAAFDTMAHGVATAALARQGTPRTVLLLFRASWQAPRLVLVGKVTANTEIHPTCSLPQGVPEAPTAAAEILRPSTTIAQNSTTTRAWGYVDDRSITCSDANANMDPHMRPNLRQRRNHRPLREHSKAPDMVPTTRLRRRPPEGRTPGINHLPNRPHGPHHTQEIMGRRRAAHFQTCLHSPRDSPPPRCGELIR